MAYTYIIGWTAHDKWYYGVRTAKTATPADLWKTYFTSSHHVKAFRAKFGEPDVVEIRKTFDCRIAALSWEEKVIDRLDAVWSPRWLNAQNAGRTFNSGPEGRPRSEKCRDKIRASRLALLADPAFAKRAADNCKEFTSRPEVKAKISAKAVERFADPVWKAGYDAAHRTEETRKLRRDGQLARLDDPRFVANHLAAVTSLEYKAKQAADSSARHKDPAYKKRVSDTLKTKLASPEHRALMSERAKASSAKRIATRLANAIKKQA